jgi:hypothetical protein
MPKAGITTEKLPELVEAALRAGWSDGEMQGKTSKTPRPVVVLEATIPVAITCANNGFVVGINPGGWDDYTIEKITKSPRTRSKRWPHGLSYACSSTAHV